MVKVNINGTIFEAPNIIQIKNGHLIIEEEKDLGVIGYECVINTVEGNQNYDGSTLTWTSKE
jgi:hypothetical protein